MMVSIWWVFAVSMFWCGVCLWMRSMAYRHGIWDGAFNHFLPVVRREMMFYAPHRAQEILQQDAERYGTHPQTQD